MQRLEAKSIHGRTYYYLSQWGWKNGKCRRLSQKYLGKLEDLAQAVQGTGPAPEYAVVLDWGLPQALWREADRAQVVEHVNQLARSRGQYRSGYCAQPLAQQGPLSCQGNRPQSVRLEHGQGPKRPQCVIPIQGASPSAPGNPLWKIQHGGFLRPEFRGFRYPFSVYELDRRQQRCLRLRRRYARLHGRSHCRLRRS